VFEGFSVDIGGSVRDEQIFVKSIGNNPKAIRRLKRLVRV